MTGAVLDTSAPRIGLALGAGGAHGIAHVLALEALDELGLRPAAITGASIGALIGAGVAAGMSGLAIREHVMTLLSDRRAFLGHLWELRPRSLSELMAAGGLPQVDPERAVGLALPAAVPERFEELAIPLTILGTDFYGWQEVRLASGLLKPAIAASIAIPGVFRPQVIDGRVLVDGGIANPLPFDALPDGLDITIAIDVVGGPEEPDDAARVPQPIPAILGSSQILMQSAIALRLRIGAPTLLVRPPISRFGELDFWRAPEILSACALFKDEFKISVDLVVNTSLSGPR
ncbi:patatin-like phospholipase family protein [Segnochrobactraceae bacterium EtOH-i3]